MASRLPPFWEMKKDPVSGREFYINHKDQTTTWQRPGGSQSHERVGSSKRSGSAWACPVCTLRNTGQRCTACNAARPPKSVQGSYASTLPDMSSGDKLRQQPVVSLAGPRSPTKALPPKSDQTPWSCPMCTLQNAANAKKCVACEKPRPPVEDLAKKEESPEFVIFADEPSRVSKDTLPNLPPDMSRQATKRSEMSNFSDLPQDQEEPHEEGSAGKPQEEEEGAQSFPEAESQPRDEPWKCHKCEFSQNPQSFSKCMMCEAPKGDVAPRQDTDVQPEPQSDRQSSKKWDPVDFDGTTCSANVNDPEPESAVESTTDISAIPEPKETALKSEDATTSEDMQPSTVPTVESSALHDDNEAKGDEKEFNFTEILETTELEVEPQSTVDETSDRIPFGAGLLGVATESKPAPPEEGNDTRMQEFKERIELENSEKLNDIRKNHKREIEEVTKQLQECQQTFEHEKAAVIAAIKSECDAKLLDTKLKQDAERQELTQIHDRKVSELQAHVKKISEDNLKMRQDLEKSKGELVQVTSNLLEKSEEHKLAEENYQTAVRDLTDSRKKAESLESQLQLSGKTIAVRDEELAKAVLKTQDIEKRAAARILDEVQKRKLVEGKLEALKLKVVSLEASAHRQAHQAPSKAPQQAQKKSWNCHVCTYENKPDATACSMCGTVKAESALEVFS